MSAVAPPLPARPAGQAMQAVVSRVAALADSPASRVGLLFAIPFVFFAYSRILDVLLPIRLPIVLGTLALLCVAIDGGLLRVLQTTAGKSLGVFTLWLFPCSILGLWPGGSLGVINERWVRAFLILFMLGALFGSLPRLWRVMQVIATAVSISGIVALVMNATDRDGRLRHLAGELANANEFGGYMVIGIVYAAGVLSYPGAGKLIRFWAVASIPVLILAIVRTGSRMAMLCLLLAVLLTLARVSMVKRLVFVLFASIGAMVALSVAPDSVTERFTKLFTTEEGGGRDEAEASAESRYALLMESIELTARNPILGVGPGNFTVAESKKAEAEGRRGMWHYPHNAYTELSSETGIPGLLLYLIGIGWAVSSFGRAKAEALARSELEWKQLGAIATCMQTVLFTQALACCFGFTFYGYFMTATIGLSIGIDQARRRLAAAMPVAAATPAVRGPANAEVGRPFPVLRRSS